MRIALLASGRSYHATRWANGLSDRGLEVGFFTVHPIVRPLAGEVEAFTIGRGRKRDYLLSARRLRTALTSWHADVVHCHYATGYGLLGKMSGHRCRVVSLYGADVFDFPTKSVIHRRMIRYVVAGAYSVLSTSWVMAKEFHRTFPDLRIPIVTPFGVDIEMFLPADSTAAEKGAFNIGVVKKLERKYGIDVLIGALELLVYRCPDYRWTLNIVGEGTQLAELEKMVAERGLSSNVRFLGPIDNSQVPQFLRAQHVFVVPSRDESESFGVAAVEAQACGVPVVATDVGGLPEVVCDGETGLVVAKEDERALSAAIETVCLDDERRQRLAYAARERVVHNYEWAKCLDQMIAIYKDAHKSRV